MKDVRGSANWEVSIEPIDRHRKINRKIWKGETTRVKGIKTTWQRHVQTQVNITKETDREREKNQMVVVVKWSACFDDPSSNPVKAYSFYSVHCLKRTKIDKKKLWTANLKRNRQRSDLEWHRQIYKLDWTKEREKERHGKQHKASI